MEKLYNHYSVRQTICHCNVQSAAEQCLETSAGAGTVGSVMSVFLYQGGFRIVQKSGVGQAIVHQKQALEAAHIPVTTQFSADTQVIHINTVFPDSLLKALWARRHGIKIVYYAHSTMEDFRNSFACSNVLAPFFRRWLLLCYVQGDVILTPTEYSKQLLLSYGIHKPV
ncbi:glycosyltransferase family 4 protein [Galactobacillus timonensis]|uniref:glycosyltransferase family 4 protein n=2 Tax=Galactobacillus timonensis TaxID=2041840 RepID=UPI002409824B|nr:glycosyltransferase family 4 protein [Galactobacillus timonensis]